MQYTWRNETCCSLCSYFIYWCTSSWEYYQRCVWAEIICCTMINLGVLLIINLSNPFGVSPKTLIFTWWSQRNSLLYKSRPSEWRFVAILSPSQISLGSTRPDVPIKYPLFIYCKKKTTRREGMCSRSKRKRMIM